MENLILRFPHLAEKIFQQLDNKGLAKSREVKKLWQKFIDERNYPWLRIVKIPRILQGGYTYMHRAAQYGQTDMFEIILNQEDNKNPKYWFETPFLIACRKGHMNIALMILKKSDELKIEVNTKNNYGFTAFHIACWNGHLEIAEMIMKYSSQLKIDLNSKDENDETAFHGACRNGKSEIAEIIMKNSSKLKIDLNGSCGKTAFHFACENGNPEIAERIMKNSSELKIDLNSKDSKGETAFHLACWCRRSDITEVIMKKSLELKIDLNSKCKWGNNTSFHTACEVGCFKIVDMMIEQSESLELDLKALDSDDKTGYQLAKERGHTDIVNLIQTKMPSLAV